MSSLEKLSGEELAKKMEELPMIERFCKEVKGEVKRRLGEDSEVPGYKLRSSGSSVTVQLEPASKILMETNVVTWEELLNACSVSERKLVELWAEKTEVTARAAREDLRSRLEKHLEIRQRAKSVIRA
jgi:hypothetical protein